MQDGAIVTADARSRKGVCTLGKHRAIYTYTGARSKTVVFGLITANGEGCFERHEECTRTEFEESLRNTCRRFGKMLMIPDRAPWHRAGGVRDAVAEMDWQIKMACLPPTFTESV